VETDVTDPEGVQRLVQRTLDAYGRLDVAFNNAGAGHMPAPLAELTLDDFDRALVVNARGIFLSMKYEIAAMLGSGGGAIVNMSSPRACVASAGSPATPRENTRSSASRRSRRSTTRPRTSASTPSGRVRSTATGSRRVALGMPAARGAWGRSCAPGGLGAVDRYEYAGDWHGEIVNLASRITDAAPPGVVLATDSVRERVPEGFRWTPFVAGELNGVQRRPRLYACERYNK
jgi:NAD(P)-dependent dehydrogenase (short-subunit alcohol dehydrogenase family)